MQARWVRKWPDGSLAHDLELELPVARAIELGDDDALELTEQNLAVGHRQRDGAAQKRCAKVRMGVGAIAVRMARVIVTVPVATRNQLLQHRADVVQECRLELVDEDSDRRMEGIDQ